MRKVKRFWPAFALCIALVVLGIPMLQFQQGKSRRRHQIGQLWSLIRFYYAPAHSGHYPNTLADLKNLPMYSPFFERAIQEIDLVSPGIQVDEVSPAMIALKEKAADKHGGIWVHEVDGSILYQFPQATAANVR